VESANLSIRPIYRHFVDHSVAAPLSGRLFRVDFDYSNSMIDGGGEMSFTEQLRRENDDLFAAIFKHPFVRGIAEGKLDREQLIHYVKQDYEYLNAFMRIYGIAISK